MTVHERIRVLRDRRGLTQRDVAEAILGGRDRHGTVVGWEKSTYPGGENLLALRELLGVNGHYLMTGEGLPEPGQDDAAERLALIRRLADPQSGDEGLRELFEWAKSVFPGGKADADAG